MMNTGGVASLVCAAAGAQVTHVDASRKAIGYARENAALSGLEDRPVRTKSVVVLRPATL